MNNFTKAFYTTKSKLTSLVLLAFFALMLFPDLASAQPWTYDFGTGTGSHTSTTASTVFLPATAATPASGLTRVRCGTNPGSFTLANPGLAGLGTGSEMQFTGNTNSTSTSKMSIYDYTAAKVGYVKFNIAFTGGTNGVFRFSLGDGATFSDSNGMNVAQTFAAVQWTKTSATAISYAFLSGGSFITTGLSNPTTTFTQSGTPVYLVEVYANNETTSQNYTRSGSNTLAAGTWDLWVDGTKVGNNLAKGNLTANVNFDSLAFNTQSSVTAPGSIYLDDIEYSNALPTLTTPTVTTTAVASVTADSATFAGNVTATGGASISGNGTVYSVTATNAAPAIAGSGVTNLATGSPGSGTGTFSSGSGAVLSPNVQYSYNAYATNSQGTSYGTVATFYTLANVASAPTVSNPTPTTLDVAITSGDGNPAATTYAIQDVASGNYVPLAGGALSATPVYQTATAWGTKTVTGLSNGTTYNFRAIARNGDLTFSTASSNGSGTTTTPSGTITTTPASYGPFCNNSSNGVSVAYSTTGTLTGTFYAQISDASGNFTNGVFTGATIIGSGASPISATIPSGLAAGTGYRVRVINDTPATYGTDNGTAFTISAPPVITSGTLADASTNVGVATTFGVTATNAVSYQWYVDTGSGFTGPIVDGTSGGVTYSNATTNILSVNPSSTAANGYKYKVTVNGNSPCGSVDSTPSGGATLTVTLAPVALATYAFEGVATATVPANVTAAAVSSVGASAISYQGGTDGGGTQIGFNTTWPASATFNASTAQYLQFDLQANSTYELTLSSASINLGRTATGPSNVTVQYSLDGFVTAGTTCLNNVTVSSTSTSALNTFALTSLPSGAFSSKITFRIWAYNSGGGNLRFNNFVINGNVALTVGSNLAAYASQPSSDIASGSTNVPLAGFSVTPTPSADFTSVTVTGVSSSPSDITNVRIFRDNNGNGIIDGADASVSGAGIAFANGNLSAMTISGETGFSGARNYLIVADISASPSSTSVGVSIGSGNFVTSLASNTGSMAVNTRTLIVPTSTLAAYGTFTGNITKGTTDALLAGFSVTPSESANFTSVTLTGVSTAPGDITSVRIFRDNNGNGLIDGADASVSGAGVAFANGNLSAISISGETGFSSIRYYIVVANVSGTATSSSVGVSIGSGNFATTLVEAGSMATNTRTLVNSALSNIIRSTGFTEPTNLAYGTYQTNNITAAGAGVGNIKIAEFTIQDGGGSNDGDGLGTILNSLTFTVSNFANVRRLALVDGATVVSDVAVSSSSATFSSLTLTAADNGSKTFSVYASFNTAVTDNQNIGLTVSAATPSPSGSGFAAGNAGAAASVVTGNTNKIVVTATKLLFGTVSGSTFNVNLPAFTVSTTDANNNRDTDINALSVTLGTDGTGATLSNPHTITAGTVSISTVQFSNPQSGIKLTASASGYSTVDSNTFTISSFAEGTWRSLSAGNWHSTVNHVNATATFERIVSGVWVPQGNYGTSPFGAIQPPTSGSANQVIIANNILLVGSNTHKNIVIESGGTLDTNLITPTFGSVLVKTGGKFIKRGNSISFDSVALGGVLEVEDGAFFDFYHTDADKARSSTIWNGTERFHANSTTTIYEVDNTQMLFFETATAVSEYTDGSSTACFGNLIIDNGSGGGQLNLVPTGFGTPGSPKKLTHQDLIIKTNSNTRPLFLGDFNAIIGRDFIVESTCSQNTTLSPTSGAFTGALTVNRNFTHSAPRTFTIANNANAGSTMAFNVLGDMTINPATTGTLNMNGNVNTVTTVNLTGDLSVSSAGLISAVSGTVSANKFNFVGNGVAVPANIQTINVASAGTATTENYRIAFDVNAGASVVLATNDLQLGTSSTFNVASGAVLDFGFDGSTALNVTNVASATGTSFTLTAGGTLKITSPQGIMASAASGNVLTNSRTFNQGGSTFHYMGKVNQNTGDVYTSGVTAKKIICDLDTNALTLTLDVPTGTSNELYIKKGIFVDTDTNKISGSAGALTIDADGTFRSGVLTATGNVPLLGGAKTYADGSTIELNAPSGGQRLEGGVGTPQYKNLIFSNGGTKITTAHSFDIKGTVTVQTGTTLDVDNNSFGGSETNLTLNGTGIYKVSGSGTKPDADGTYNLAATSTVEFYGSSATVVKLGSPAVSYGNVVVSGTNVSSTSATTGILFKSGGSFTVKQGATFTFRQPGGLNGLVNSAVSSTNNPTVTIENTPSLSTIVYNGVGQSLTGRADYGNLIINNTSGALTTSGDVTVSGTLTLTKGIVSTGANTIAVTNDTTPISGGSNTAYISGKLRLTYPATGTNVARTFPIGKGSAYRPVTFTYDSNPGSRTVLIEQFESAFPGALPSTASQFGTRYWNITQSSVGASYKVTLDAGPATTSGTVVMIRREGTGASTSNEVTTPNYTNVTSYNTTDVSNDVSFGECTVCSFIMPAQCGSTLPDINATIYCYGITGATDFRFKVTKAGTDYIFDNDSKNIRAFVLSQIPGVAEYSTTYGVSVSAFIGGVWQAYGRVCTITTPPNITVNTTQIMLNQCGSTLSTLNSTIYATAVVGATQYRFEVTGGSFGVRTVDSSFRYFTLSQLLPGGGEYSKTYSIRVAINNGIWQGYGPACNVSTPAAPAPRMAAQDINTNVFEVKAFPNPFARHFSLDIQSSSDYLVQVKVYDMIGRELEVQKATVSELSTKEIGTNYPSGVYNVVVSQGDKVKSVRMIKR